MRPKRGKDHTWQLVKYKADIAIYAKCRCGYSYPCSGNTRNENGTWNPKQVIKYFYPYCPMCGARKKWYSEDIEKIDKFSFE